LVGALQAIGTDGGAEGAGEGRGGRSVVSCLALRARRRGVSRCANAAVDRIGAG
jgi:hypothetical protein